MAQNLSVPLAFVALLHLANEKVKVAKTPVDCLLRINDLHVVRSACQSPEEQG